MLTIYALKQRFQALLRPLVALLAATGVSANAVTLGTMAVSCLLGAFLFATHRTSMFLMLPVWMFLRMALNAIDGMLAREHGQETRLGAYLNELADVVSDAFLFLPFVVVPPFGWASVGAVIFLSALSEFAGALGASIGTGRRYDGPMGKSDRALAFGFLGFFHGIHGSLPEWTFWIVPAIASLIAVNVVNRVRGGLASISSC